MREWSHGWGNGKYEAQIKYHLRSLKCILLGLRKFLLMLVGHDFALARSASLHHNLITSPTVTF